MPLKKNQVINDRRIVGYPVEGEPTKEGDFLIWDEEVSRWNLKNVTSESKALFVNYPIPNGGSIDIPNMSLTLPNNKGQSIINAMMIIDQTTDANPAIFLRDQADFLLQQVGTFEAVRFTTAHIFLIVDNMGQTVRLQTFRTTGTASIRFSGFVFQFKELL